MEFTLTTTCSREIETPAFAMLCFSDEPPSEETAGGVLKEMYDSGEFTGKANETAVVHRPDGMKAQRLLLVGCGEKAKFTPAQMRTAGGVMARALQARSIQQAAIRLKRLTNEPPMLRALVEGLITGGFEPDQYKTEKKNGGKLLERVEISCIEITPELQQALETARIVGEAQNWTRALVNEPGNVLTPRVMAERARAMAAECGLECEILDEPRMRQLGFNTLLGVAQGSAEPPVMIIVRYTPEQPASEDHVALVGKGVTFDTGGYSLKQRDGMIGMKGDMSGAAAVLGAMQAVAELQVDAHVVGIVPASENLVDSAAYRPQDVITASNGKTIEIISTDAEGRLLLADALVYAKRFAPDAVVDIATLTGSAASALGGVYSAVFSTDTDLRSALERAGEVVYERVWPMPMAPEYRKQIDSDTADMRNSATVAKAGASVAAMFLSEFVDYPVWAHVDMAGTFVDSGASAYIPAKGMSGYGARLLTQFIIDWATRKGA